ncbi:hypothetical protein TrVGV298_003655 [Trichoderma virens]|nr:hypothetical protein TrVGV298_003655 [Trichoderma virens]
MNPDQPPDSSSMSLSTSPAHDVAKLMGRRSLSNIPKDQRSLLELENSWAVDQKDGPHGLATVPSHVLKTLKEAFIRLKDENEKENPKDDENSDLAPTTNDRDGQNSHSPSSTPARSNSDGAPPSSPEIPIAWSQSPVGSRAEQDDEMSDAGSPIEETPSSPAPAPLTQPLLFHGTPSPGPSSSASEPEDLEMELPQPQKNHNTSINREAPINYATTQMHLTATPQEPASLVTSMVTTTDTPPCAQPLVASAPCTSSEDPKSSVVQADPTHGRSRRMKPIEFSEDSPKVVARSTNSVSIKRMPSKRALPEEHVQNSASLSSSNSAPYNHGRVESAPSPPPPPPPPHNFAARDATPRNRTSERLDGANSEDISRHRHTPLYQLFRIQAPAVDVFISEHSDPYTAFTATYPDYVVVHSGNLLAFIQACVYLEMLQEELAIREYLYDDFIRAWSSGFLRYVQNASPGQEPLPAIQWFNMQKGPILFNRMCITTSNIGVVLNAYPEEAARARAIIHATKETDERQASEPQSKRGLEMELEEEPDKEPSPEPKRRRERERERERHVVDLLDSDNAMDITVVEERRAEPELPPPTRNPPSLPAPSRVAPLAPPPIPRPLSPEPGSDDFDSPPPPSKPQSRSRSSSRAIPKPRKRSAEERARLKEHFRKKATSSSTSFLGSGADN